MELLRLLGLLTGEYPKQVAVMKIEGAKAGGLDGLPMPLDAILLFRRVRLRERTFRPAVGKDAPANVLQGVVLPKVPREPEKPFLARWPDGDVLTDLDLVILTA